MSWPAPVKVRARLYRCATECRASLGSGTSEFRQRSDQMVSLRTPILLAVAFIVASCSGGSPRIWQRHDTTNDQTQTDEAACIQPVSRDSSEGPSRAKDNQETAGTAVRARQQQIDSCMERSGYQLDRSKAAEPVR